MGMISKKSSPTWFIIAFCIARITMGAFVRYLNKRIVNLSRPLPLSKLFFSITGPTLPILAHNMNVSLPEVNWAITVRQGTIKLIKTNSPNKPKAQRISVV